MIPLLDLTRQYQDLKSDIDAAAIGLLSSGQYILGPAVDEFETQAAQALGVKHAVGVANGTDALQIALQAMGVGAGDEVITTSFSFFATAEVISRLGAIPVFVDIEEDTFNIDPIQVEAAITPRTKAIIPVHLFGHPAPMNELLAIARRHNLRVLEDAAQAWGASLKIDGQSKGCGAQGDIASFSFYPTKNLGACGEGGLITTDNDEFAAKARSLRVHGQYRRYYHDDIGYNSRLHALQAAILSVKLPHAERWNQARRQNAAFYNEQFRDTGLVLPSERVGAHHVYHQYTLRVPENGALSREHVCEILSQRGVSWAIFYPVCLHLQAVYQKQNLGYGEGSLPVSERAAREVLSLPVFPELRPDELEAVAAAVREACS
jgi:dTDP-4-amino-4,6-dideoxygalactose transaminase